MLWEFTNSYEASAQANWSSWTLLTNSNATNFEIENTIERTFPRGVEGCSKSASVLVKSPLRFGFHFNAAYLRARHVFRFPISSLIGIVIESTTNRWDPLKNWSMSLASFTQMSMEKSRNFQTVMEFLLVRWVLEISAQWPQEQFAILKRLLHFLVCWWGHL